MKRLITPVRYQGDSLEILDQTLLPEQEKYIQLDGLDRVVDAIKELRVRGAPAIGIAAAYGYIIGLKNGLDEDEVFNRLSSSRPTAVNLFQALNRMRAAYYEALERRAGEHDVITRLEQAAKGIEHEDLQASLEMAEKGLELMADARVVLTHCNTGALATAGLGTALGVIRKLFEEGNLELVIATETRPLLQGARLTAWELEKYGIPYRLIVDSAAPYIMKKYGVDAVVVGADRVARNGDTANKIGTFMLAVAADYLNIPFYVVCPESTIDEETDTGADIVIEERDGREVSFVGGLKIAPSPGRCLNYAFDVTPARLITAVITDKRIIYPDRC